MAVDIDPNWVAAVLLVSLRLGVLFLLAPFLAGLGRLVTVRVLLSFALGALLVNGAVSLPSINIRLDNLISAAIVELVTGGTLAFGVFAAFGAFSVAGKVLDIQSGFGIGSVYDPVTQAGAPLFSTLLNMGAAVIFFGMDAHHTLMRGIAFSLQHVPPGTRLDALPVDAVVRQFGLTFSLGVALVIPVILILLLVELGLAVISRVLPQMNVIMVMVPVKIAAGLAVLALTITSLQAPMSNVFASIFIYWEQVLA
jgi:flagellar biosynthetic protein FliR